jgi:signal transduction histidine kinase
VTFFAKTLIFESLLMNYQGNALKYTRAGYIRVRLEAHNQPSERTSLDGEEQAPATIVKLTVTDTGQGMSPQFMRTKVGYMVRRVW